MHGPTAPSDQASDKSEHGDGNPEDAGDEEESALAWMDQHSPPPNNPKPRKRRRRVMKKSISDVPAEIEDAVAEWFGMQWHPCSQAQRQWRVEDWWRANENDWPMMAKLARRVLATQVTLGIGMPYV